MNPVNPETCATCGERYDHETAGVAVCPDTFHYCRNCEWFAGVIFGYCQRCWERYNSTAEITTWHQAINWIHGAFGPAPHEGFYVKTRITAKVWRELVRIPPEVAALTKVFQLECELQQVAALLDEKPVDLLEILEAAKARVTGVEGATLNILDESFWITLLVRIEDPSASYAELRALDHWAVKEGAPHHVMIDIEHVGGPNVSIPRDLRDSLLAED